MSRIQILNQQKTSQTQLICEYRSMFYIIIFIRTTLNELEGLIVRNIKKHQIERAELVFRGRMAKTNFLDHPAFKYSFDSSGFQKFTFGAVTGPSIAINNIFHEMAHAVDFVLCGDDIEQRTLGGRFNFGVKMIGINGQFYEQVETTQCTKRECRTFAIQLKLMHSVGFKTNLEFFANDVARLTTWLPDWFLVEGESETERVEWCKQYIVELYKNLDEFEILNAFQKWLNKLAMIQTHTLAQTT